MARETTKWPSTRWPITKIMSSDGCNGDTVPLAVGKWYDFHEFGWYMGNVGSVLPCLYEIEPVPEPQTLPDHIEGNSEVVCESAYGNVWILPICVIHQFAQVIVGQTHPTGSFLTSRFL